MILELILNITSDSLLRRIFVDTKFKINTQPYTIQFAQTPLISLLFQFNDMPVFCILNDVCDKFYEYYILFLFN